jgi:quercetin dioxygenase-like cupin family protein
MANRKQGKKASLIAEASNLSDLITYEEGSVVSRTLIDKTAGSVTLFAFDENQALSEHTAPYDAFVYVIVGQANFTIAGKQVKLKQDEMTIMPANKPHALVAITKFKMLLVMIKS